MRDLLITHAMHNHFGGSESALEIRRELCLPVQKMDCNFNKVFVLKRDPEFELLI